MKLLKGIECIVQDNTKKIVSDNFNGFIYYDPNYGKIVTNTGADFYIADYLLSAEWNVEPLTKGDLEDGNIVEYINKTLGYCYETIDDVYICDIISSCEGELTEEFLDTILQYYCNDEEVYNSIIEYQQVSESFLRKHCQHPCFNEDAWENVGYTQKLSEAFMSDFHSKLDWFWISKKQDFSQEFALKYHDKINWEEVIKRKMFPTNFYLDNFQILSLEYHLNNLIKYYDDFKTLICSLIEKHVSRTCIKKNKF